MLYRWVAGWIGITLLAAPLAAAPPDWAPAHGYRKKQAQGATARPAVMQPAVAQPAHYGVLDGHCNRDAIGAVGGYVGHEVSDGNLAATAVGTLVGAVLGNAIGDALDAADRACTQQALDYAPDNRPVRWQNGERTYVLTPLARSADGACRDFLLTASSGANSDQARKRACRAADRSWLIQD